MIIVASHRATGQIHKTNQPIYSIKFKTLMSTRGM